MFRILSYIKGIIHSLQDTFQLGNDLPQDSVCEVVMT